MNNKIIYITSMGTLSRKDNTLFFENKEIKKVIPIIGIEEIFCLNEVSINSKLLEYLTEMKITLHFFNYHSFYEGTYHPKEHLLSGKLIIKQAEAYIDMTKRIYLAKQFVIGTAKNLIITLEHYNRHGKETLEDIQKIRNIMNLLEKNDKIENINEIMGYEGNIWTTFYQSFEKYLPEEFVIQARVKRPPDNPMNALISFGNSILYANVINKIYYTQLNPTISYLHEAGERRFSLALDIAESFKPMLTFGTIFNLINRGGLSVEKHFDKKMNYALLNEDGRKLFLKHWDERLKKTIDHGTLGRKVSYGSLIKYDCYKLIKYLIKDTNEFNTFNIKNSY